jgi:hypothetical protein
MEEPEDLRRATELWQEASTPIAVQLRFLQTMREVASERNTTTFFPVPIDLVEPFLAARQKPLSP